MTKLSMPKIDRKLISRKTEIVESLKKIVKAENILDHEDQIRPFETDALSAYKQKPLIVVFPEAKEPVRAILIILILKLTSLIIDHLFRD